MAVFVLTLLMSVSAFAAQKPDPALVAALEQETVAAPTSSTLTYKYSPVIREKRVSLIIPSVVVHGFAIDKDVAAQMPRKIDNGQTVVTPGVGLEYVSQGGFLVIGGMLKDCYDNLAGLLQVGQRFKLASHTSVGYSLGIYARETPMACRTTTTRSGRKITTCDEFDNYELKWMTQINGEDIDIIPMPFLHFTTALYRDRNVEVDFKVMTNFALNEFGLSIPF